jgi:hypothetical protein
MLIKWKVNVKMIYYKQTINAEALTIVIIADASLMLVRKFQELWFIVDTLFVRSVCRLYIIMEELDVQFVEN